MQNWKKYKSLIFLFLFDFTMVALFYLFPNKRLFDLDGENNIPTLYQASKLILIAFFSLALLLLNQYFKLFNNQIRLILIFFFLVFFFLGIDEAGQIHENIAIYFHEFFPQPTSEYIEESREVGFKSSEWLLFYWPIILAFVISFIFLFRTIISKYIIDKHKLLVVGSLFFISVPIIEFLNTSETSFMINNYKEMIVLEESAEMIGASIFFVYFVTFFDSQLIRLIKAREDLSSRNPKSS